MSLGNQRGSIARTRAMSSRCDVHHEKRERESIGDDFTLTLWMEEEEDRSVGLVRVGRDISRGVLFVRGEHDTPTGSKAPPSTFNPPRAKTPRQNINNLSLDRYSGQIDGA